MSDTVIKIENLSKIYRLGEIGTGTLSHDLNRWWAMNIRGKDDPYAKIGGVNVTSGKATKGELIAALQDINLEVKQGEVLGIIGKNGAGKSTLLKVLSRVTSPTTGSISVKGRLASLLEVGTGFHPEMTGRENIYMNGTIMGMRKWEIARKLDEIVEFAGVAKYLDTPVKRYSSGMKVRLGFAVAAHLEPEILVVDEVLAVGDAEFQKKAIGKMQDVSTNDGRTVLFVSHNMASVKSLCTNGVVLNNGRIVYKNKVDKSVSFYLDLSKKNLGTPIKERKDRIGNQKIKIIDSYFLDENENKTPELISGLPAKLILEYEKNSKINPKNLFIGVTFFDENEIKQTLIANDELGYIFQKIDDFGKFTIDINKLNFRAGRFTYSIFISEKLNNSAQHEKIDVIQQAGEFEVKPGDYWNVGNINRPQGFIIEAQMY